MQRKNIIPESWHTKSFMLRSMLSMIIIVVLVFVSLSVASHIQQINSTLDNSIYSSLESSLKNLSDMMELMFEKDEASLDIVADGMSGETDKVGFLAKLSDNSGVYRYFYSPVGNDTAYSPDGTEFRESEYEFVEHENGGVRSRAFMSETLDQYAYFVRVPVNEGGETVGYLYGEYVFSEFSSLLPMNVLNYSDVSVIDSETFEYVYEPKIDTLGMHVDFQSLGSYISDDGEAQIIINDVEERMHEHKYSMDLIRFKNGVDYIMYMWPVGDGEYYLTGFAAAGAMQKERSSVQSTVKMIVILMVCVVALIVGVLGISMISIGRSAKQKAAIQQKYNEELRSALAIAQEANQSKSTFLSNMSHDIRTPMNAVVGFTALLEKEADDPEKVREYTKKINGAGNYLLGIINDILDMSKIETGNTTLSVADFRLGELVTSVESVIRPQVDDKKQKLIIRTSGIQHENVSGDETRVRQIIVNLLSNAVKYTQPGGRISFTLSGLPQKSPRIQRIRIVVKDNGYGMTPEFVKTIFDPFTRAENSTTNKVQGTGLGMAITKNIVDLMGGTIKVESRPDEGSVFTVDLGLTIAASSADEAFWAERGIKRVLVVSEDERLCRNVKEAMEDAKIATDVAMSSRRAAEAAEAAGQGVADYRIVLVDWEIKAADKAEVFRAVRGCVSEDAVIIAMRYESDDIGEAHDAGADGVISRNFFLSSLQDRIADIESRRSSSADDMTGLQGLKILAAEDNELNAEILKEILGMFGAECEIYDNGEKASDRFIASEKGEYDLILMDVQMSVMNGYEATMRIRSSSHPDAQTIPVIAMTANAFAEDVQNSIDAGMDAHVSKPVDITVLSREIKELMREKHIRSANCH